MHGQKMRTEDSNLNKTKTSEIETKTFTYSNGFYIIYLK